MSLKTELQAAIDYCNVALQSKGADTASTVYGIGDKIDTIQTGGTPTGDCWEYLEKFIIAGADVGLADNATVTVHIPPKVTSLADCFTSSMQPRKSRKYNYIIHNTGSDITSLATAFAWSQRTPRRIELNFDTNKVTDYYRMFSTSGLGVTYLALTLVGELDFSAATRVTDMFNWAFSSSKMSSVRFKKETLHLSLDLGGLNPDDDSLQSIIEGLADMTGQTAQTLTMDSAVSARLTAEQIASATAKNWTIA